MIQRDVSGSVAMVTGASRGIGRAIAQALAAAGCHLALVGRTRSGLEETAATCADSGVKTLVLPADLESPAEQEALIQQVTSNLGALDILINNAGVFVPGDVSAADPAAWGRLMEVNLLSAMRLTHLALPHLVSGRRGAVVFIASLAGRFTAGGMAAYCASKHGLMGFSGCLFDEVRDHGVKVSSICPGWTDTDMMSGSGVDPHSAIRPEDVAASVLFVVQSSESVCPVEIQLHPQRTPKRLPRP